MLFPNFVAFLNFLLCRAAPNPTPQHNNEWPKGTNGHPCTLRSFPQFAVVIHRSAPHPLPTN